MPPAADPESPSLPSLMTELQINTLGKLLEFPEHHALALEIAQCIATKLSIQVMDAALYLE